ncbi:hypothetical protein P618_200307 [Holospora obtusa F1]|uniref:Uncharacterized protein n=1 Tax=Holospora obtusa F1 TaxID=1399147 RepID=W6TEA6_HOLOB|nr:hypothetical protein [Holospora obtusa]ETZ07498.1 hypothetical protein P618_200307 [Holospora obtusa F1]
MSTHPYRIDLREKVIHFIKAGNYKSKGHFRPKIRLGANPTIEKESFIQY